MNNENGSTEEERKAWREEMERRLVEDERWEDEHGGASTRTTRRDKRKSAPTGGTRGGQAKRMETTKGGIRGRLPKPDIKIVDKTEK